MYLQVRKLKATAEQKQKNGTEEMGSTDEDDLQNGLDPHILDLQSKIHLSISITISLDLGWLVIWSYMFSCDLKNVLFFFYRRC